jgi:ABC-type sugar transport system substrate-binding protein
MKIYLLRIASVVLIITLVAACSSGGTASQEEAEPGAMRHFRIGYPVLPIHNATMAAMEVNRRAVAEAAGGELITEVFDFTPEGTINAVENLIQAGVDGILVTPSAQYIMPTISRMAYENQVYFIVSMRKLTDPEIIRVLHANPFFVGAVHQGDFEAGYALGRAFAEAGGRYFALIGTFAGDPAGDARERGLASAAENYGLVQLAEIRAYTQAADSAAAVQSFMAAFPELHGIIRVASIAAGDVNVIASTLEDAGRGGELIFVTYAVDAGSDEFLERGTIAMTLGNALVIDSLLAASLLVNAILGTPITEEPVDLLIPFPVLNNWEDLEKQNTFVLSQEPLFNHDEIRYELLRWFNPDVTYDSFLYLANNFSPSMIAQRRMQ